MKNTLCLGLSLLLAGAAIASAEVDLSKLPAAAAKKDVTFEKDIKPMLEASCFHCHGDKNQKGGLRFDSLEATLKGGKEGKVVQPGNALKSQLLISVSQLDPESAMPPKPRARKPGQRGPGEKRRERGTNAPAANPPPNSAAPGAPWGPGFGEDAKAPKPLTADQVALVRAWIEQGAK